MKNNTRARPSSEAMEFCLNNKTDGFDLENVADGLSVSEAKQQGAMIAAPSYKA